MTPEQLAPYIDMCHELVAPGGVVSGTGGTVIASHARIVRCLGIEAMDTPAARGEFGYSSSTDIRVAKPTQAYARENVGLPTFAVALQRVYIRSLRAILDSALVRLKARTSLGTSLLHRQMVQGEIANAAGAIDESSTRLAALSSTDGTHAMLSLWQIHHGLVQTGRSLIKLYGAAGFLDNGPGAVIYVNELLGNTYLYWDDGNGCDRSAKWARDQPAPLLRRDGA